MEINYVFIVFNFCFFFSTSDDRLLGEVPRRIMSIPCLSTHPMIVIEIFYSRLLDI